MKEIVSQYMSNGVNEDYVFPDAEMSELSNFKVFLNPYRLAIMNAISKNFNMTRSLLEEIIGGNRGTFGSHLTKLIDEGYLDAETQFVDGNRRMVIHLSTHGLQSYNKFKDLFTAF